MRRRISASLSGRSSGFGAQGVSRIGAARPPWRPAPLLATRSQSGRWRRHQRADYFNLLLPLCGGEIVAADRSISIRVYPVEVVTEYRRLSGFVLAEHAIVIGIEILEVDAL